MNHLDRANQRQGKSAHVLRPVASDNHYPVVQRMINGKKYNMLASQSVDPSIPSLNHRMIHYRLNSPVGALNNAFETQGTENEFSWSTKGKRAVLSEVYLDVTLNNANTGGTTTTAPAEFWIDEYDILINNSGQRIQTIKGTDLWLANHVNESPEELIKYGAVSSTSTAWVGNSTIGTTSTARYRIRLDGFWKGNVFPLGEIDKLQFRFRQSGVARSLLSDGTGGSVTISSMQMLFVAYELSEHEYNDLKNRMHDPRVNGMAIRFVKTLYHRETLTLANNSNYVIDTQLKGISPALYILFRQSDNASSSGHLLFEAVVDKYDIQDEGTGIFHGVRKLGDETLYLDTMNFKSAMFQTANRRPYIHQFVAGGDFAVKSSSNQVLGFDSFSKLSLDIDTNTVPSSNSFNVDIYLKVYSVLLLDHDGVAKVIDS